VPLFEGHARQHHGDADAVTEEDGAPSVIDPHALTEGLPARTRWSFGPRDWFGGPIPSDKREAFAAEVADTNRRRMLVLLPLFVIGHAIHVAVFRIAASERAALAPNIVRWRDGVAAAHAVTLVIGLMLIVAVWRVGRTRAGRWIGPVAAAIYLMHGAVVAGIDQLSVTAITPFVGYGLGVAVVVCLAPAEALVVYAVGLATFVPAILVTQPSPSARLAILPNGFTIVVLSVALSWVLHLARRRDFAQRATIEAQRATLAELNVGLEQRVKEQIAEIVERARQVEALNAQLHAKVRARSAELSMALAKLARHGTAGALRPGVVLGDRFEIEDMIGAGGMGAVYRAVDRTNGTRVAIKIFQASSSQQLDTLHRFIREAGTAATVAHPAVVRMIHVDVSEDGMLFHAQELVDGETLQRRLQRGNRWQPGVAARLASVLSDALAAAHAVGVVHRDVKPANVMITSAAPGLRLLDFGISKFHDDEGGDEGATRTGAILGTPAYMAPEQVVGQAITGSADVYAVGVILFLLLTGQRPFEDTSPRGSAFKIALHHAPDVRSLQPEVPAALSRLVSRCLERNPESRPQALELGAELATLADAEGVPSLEVLEQSGSVRAEGSSMNLRETLVESGRQPA
jgi:hypothetical protein